MKQKRLTERQQEVMDKLLKGKRNIQIAKELKITIKTVKFHLTNIYKFHRVRSCKELIVKCLVK